VFDEGEPAPFDRVITGLRDFVGLCPRGDIRGLSFAELRALAVCVFEYDRRPWFCADRASRE
jgi:hypothetical protein